MKKLLFIIAFFRVTSIFAQDIFCVQDEWTTGKYNFVDNQNKILFSGNYRLINQFSEGMGIVQFNDMNQTKAYVDVQGNVIRPQFPKGSVGAISLFPFSHNYGLVIIGDTAGYLTWCYFINKRGEIVSEVFHRANSFSEGIAVVQSSRNGTYKAIGTNFKTLFEIKSAIHDRFYDTWQFKSGLLPVVNIREEWGYIDKTGQLVIQPKREFGADFSGDYAISRTNNFIFNKSGETVFTVERKLDIRYQPMNRYIYIFNDKLIILDNEIYIHDLIDRSNQDIVLKIEFKGNPLQNVNRPLSRYYAYNMGEYLICYDGIYDYSGNRLATLPNNGVYVPDRKNIWYNRYWVEDNNFEDLIHYINK